MLNTERISRIKDYTLSGGDYPAALVLNWNSATNPLRRRAGTLEFRDEERSAQLIDGQHRLAGISEAINERPELGDLELPVAIYENLDTQACADLFVSINTEQKPVPRSLVFDLYGLASESVVDQAAVRARDIASFLNETKHSPYFDDIKFPGSPRRRGGIALSTAVSAMKPLVEDKGNFEQIGVRELEWQQKIVLNFFRAIATHYGREAWEDQSNAFRYAAGFVGAVDFLKLKIIPYCNQVSSFTTDTIQSTLSLGKNNLILQSELKGLGGREATNTVYQRLVNAFRPEKTEAKKFRI